MFMSSLEHSHGRVEIVIREASKERKDYNQTVAYHGKEILRLALTESQFAHFITTPGRGMGVPCTITRRDGQFVPDCPPDDQRVQFDKDLKRDANKALGALPEILSTLDEVLEQKSIRKGDLRALRDRLANLKTHIQSNMPHVVQMFEEYMEGVFADAVARFEGHVKVRTEEIAMKAMSARYQIEDDEADRVNTILLSPEEP
jgi:uncharacterized NAD(P)/FAD-binding protein YdhS